MSFPFVLMFLLPVLVVKYVFPFSTIQVTKLQVLLTEPIGDI